MNTLRRIITYLSIFVLILLSIPASSVFAQQKTDLSGPIIEVNIDSTSYNAREKEVTFNLDVKNRSESRFLDNLNYRIELYNGDKLSDTMLLFSTVEFVTSTSGEIRRLSPGQSIREVIKYSPPGTIPKGKYFFRVFVFNDDNSHYGASYTSQPLYLNGKGGFLGILNAALINVEKGTVHALMEGPIIKKDARPLVSILREANPELFERLDDGEKLYASYEITHITAPEEILYSQPKVSLIDLYRPDGTKALEIPFNPLENQLSGAHTVLINFTNERDEKIAEDMRVRLLYEGLLGRIFLADTSVNSYRRGEPFDLKVNVLAAGDVNAEYVTMDATFKAVGGYEQSMSQKIDLPGTLKGVDMLAIFQNETAKKKMLVEEIYIVLKDQNGNILDEDVITMDTSTIFAYPRDSNLFRNILISLAILIILVVTAGLINKKTRLLSSAMLIAFVLVGGSLLYKDSDFVYADAGLGPTDLPSVYQGTGGKDVNDIDGDGDSDEELPKPQLTGDLIGIWETPSNTPSGNQGLCEEQCTDIIFWVKMQCKECSNQGLNLEVNYFNNWHGQASPDGPLDQQVIFSTANLGATNDYGYYTVQADSDKSLAQSKSDKEELAKAPEGDFVGTPVNSSDIINWWIWGPFAAQHCFEDDGIDDSCNITGSNVANGVLTQPYNIQAKTQFAPGYCEFSYGLDDTSGMEDVQYLIDAINEILTEDDVVTLNDTLSMSCDVPGCVKGSLFKDTDSDGGQDVTESYFRPSGSSVGWGGIEADVSALITNGTNINLDLLMANLFDSSESRPYFLKIVPPGFYTASLGTGVPSGWSQTNNPSPFNFNVSAGQITDLKIAANNTNPVVFSCSAIPGGTIGADEGDLVDDGETCPPGYIMFSGSCVWIGFGDGAWWSGSGGGGGDRGSGRIKDECPGGAGNAYIQPTLEISNIGTNLQQCYEHELPLCEGLDENGGEYRKTYHMIGYSVRLKDPCYPGELWFVKSYFRNGLVGNTIKKNGDSWDIAVGKNLSGMHGLWDDNFHGIASDGWTGRSSINNGQTRTISTSDKVELTMCECDLCLDANATNHGQPLPCEYPLSNIEVYCENGEDDDGDGDIDCADSDCSEDPACQPDDVNGCMQYTDYGIPDCNFNYEANVNDMTQCTVGCTDSAATSGYNECATISDDTQCSNDPVI